MAEQPAPAPRFDEVIAGLRARVEQRRRDGVYPPELEHDLEEHFRRIVAHRASPDFTDVRARLAALDERTGFSVERIHAQSHLPGGQALHRGVSKLVGRQTQGALDQVQHYADGVRDVLVAVVAALEDPEGHVHADLVGQLDAVLERIAGYERRADAAAASVSDLARRVEQLEATAAGAD